MPVIAEESVQPAQVQDIKVTSLHYDNNSSIICISTVNSENIPPLKYVKLSEPNRIYFDINNAILIGGKQQLGFENSPIKELRLAQFETNPNIVRTVITFQEDFDTSNVKLTSVNGIVIVQVTSPQIKNDYFNLVYSDEKVLPEYANIVAETKAVQKVAMPQQSQQISGSEAVVKDIQKAFGDSTLQNSDGKTYEEVTSIDISSKLKLRTKYYINQYIPKNNGLLVSGVGQLTTAKMFYLNSPKRAVIDLPNTYLDKSIRNKEINICPDLSCKDIAKIGQFDISTARIVITSDKAEKYLPVYSQDSQSMFIADSDKLNHTSLSNVVANLNKAYVKKIDSKTGELILSFTAPVTYSIIRNDSSFNLYLFNVKSYNEQDLIKTLNGTLYKQITMSLLPQTGIRGGLEVNKNDIVKVEQSVDSKAIKITVIKGKEEQKFTEKIFKRGSVKNKIVLDAGHGGTDYGAIREGINEKDITLDVTQRVASILKSKGYKVALTRSEDVYVSLEDRVDFSEKEEPEIFVSIHVNSAVSTDPNGVETHWYHEYSKPLAEVIHKNITKNLPKTKDRGLFKSKFYVINHTTVPAVLCEIGFISNEDERNQLITDERKQKTAKAIADGIIEYLKGGK